MSAGYGAPVVGETFLAEPGGYDGLRDRFAGMRRAYAAADPFPHAVATGLFDDEALRRVVAEFSEPAMMSEQFANARELKSAESRWDRFGPATRAAVAEMQSGPFVAALEALTGIEGLLPDPHLVGGGQHQIGRGGLLKVHADFNQHNELRLDRRLNVLVYLNEGWHDDWGGHLELWDRTMTECRVRVVPRFNTFVVFSTTSTSYHGHPDPLSCPQGIARKSLAFYYYTAARVTTGSVERHTTLFRDRPGENVARLPLRERARLAARHVHHAATALRHGGPSSAS